MMNGSVSTEDLKYLVRVLLYFWISIHFQNIIEKITDEHISNR